MGAKWRACGGGYAGELCLAQLKPASGCLVQESDLCVKEPLGDFDPSPLGHSRTEPRDRRAQSTDGLVPQGLSITKWLLCSDSKFGVAIPWPHGLSRTICNFKFLDPLTCLVWLWSHPFLAAVLSVPLASLHRCPPASASLLPLSPAVGCPPSFQVQGQLELVTLSQQGHAGQGGLPAGRPIPPFWS